MINNNINFFEKRDFGEIIGVSFNFIFEERKILGKALLLYVFPMFLLTLIIQHYFPTTATTDPPVLEDVNYSRLFLSYLLQFASNVLAYSVIGSYIKLYIRKGSGNFSIEDVWSNTLQILGKIALIQVAVGLMLVFGLIVFVIPGIFIAVATIFAHFIVIFEDEYTTNAIKKSFYLVKNNWWVTFGFIIVLLIVIIFISVIFSSLYEFLPIAMQTGTNSIIFSVLVSMLSLILMTFYQTGISLLYFKFSEEKDHGLLLNRILEINEIEEEEEENRFTENNESTENNTEDENDRFKPED